MTVSEPKVEALMVKTAEALKAAKSDLPTMLRAFFDEGEAMGIDGEELIDLLLVTKNSIVERAGLNATEVSEVAEAMSELDDDFDEEEGEVEADE